MRTRQLVSFHEGGWMVPRQFSYLSAKSSLLCVRWVIVFWAPGD
jgi:hypothetical protein